jgi:NADPH:quinone reductase-like Zn-dependent oxidoreductase
MLTQYALLHQDGVVRFPDHLTFEEAATLPCAAVTAWNALQHAGISADPIRPGETVLIQGTGGVSLFALQFAKILGAKVIGTSSSDEKLSRARSLGLTAGLNYKERPDWSKWAAEITGGEGVDRIMEVGGLGTFGQSLRAVRVGGMVAQIGVLTGPVGEPIPMPLLLHKQIRIHGIYVGSRAMFEEMNATITATGLHPIIDRIFEFDQAQQAFQHMESASHFGKIVIRIT